ncbi:unnamed protein product [Miscanthus lutarioriparius]|uniref:Uncharacterized protein n=1 Tax=Miscanthus lutarioriparius TaxID=422564 RepID=A0A811R6K1_9POAL|nr:unnamed protein product [Miscanthus lutarioriparius]
MGHRRAEIRVTPAAAPAPSALTSSSQGARHSRVEAGPDPSTASRGKMTGGGDVAGVRRGLVLGRAYRKRPGPSTGARSTQPSRRRTAYLCHIGSHAEEPTRAEGLGPRRGADERRRTEVPGGRLHLCHIGSHAEEPTREGLGPRRGADDPPHRGAGRAPPLPSVALLIGHRPVLGKMRN